jgi:predicted DsbA family dithiol-disulfide isomerase
LARLAQSHPVSVHWRSFELRPREAPPIPAEYRAKIEAGRPRLVAVAREQYNLELNPGPFGIDSRPALVGAKIAEAAGKGPAYHAAAMAAYWQEAKDLGQRSVLADIASAAGLGVGEFLAALDDPAYDAQVQADIDTAHAYGIDAVPALVFVDKYLVSGAQPYAVLVQAVEQIAAEESADPDS